MIKGIIFLLDLVWMGKKRNLSYTWRKYWMNEFFGTKIKILIYAYDTVKLWVLLSGQIICDLLKSWLTQ